MPTFYEEEILAIHSAIDESCLVHNRIDTALLHAYVSSLVEGTEEHAVLIKKGVQDTTPPIVAHRIRRSLHDLEPINVVAARIAKPLMLTLGLEYPVE